MVKKEMPLLDGPPEFERYTAEVRFPSNLNGDVKNTATDKIRLVKNANIKDDMTDEEALNQVENVGEVMEEVQNHILDWAVKYMEETESGDAVERKNLTPEAVDIILEQYEDSLKGVKVSGN